MPEEEDTAPDTQALPRGFLFNINFVFFFTLISNTVGFFVAVVLARALGPDGRGVVALYQAAVYIGFAFVNLGISSAVFYFVVRREMSGRQATEAGLSISLLAALVAASGVGVTALFFAGYLEGKDIPYGLAILAVPAILQLRIITALLRADGRFGAMNALEFGLPISMLVCVGGVEAVAGLTVRSAVWAWTLGYLMPLVAGYTLLGRAYWPRALAPVSLLVKAIKFGAQSQATILIQLLNYRLDVFLIVLLVNTAGVGLYTVAISQTEGLWIIADSAAIVLLTSITAGDETSTAHVTPVVCRNTILVTAIGAIGAAIIAGIWIPLVFGSAYRGSIAPYLWLLPGTVAFAGAKILAAYVFSRGRPIINAWIALANLAVSLPVTVVLTSMFGIPGAAAGTTVGYLVSLALTALAYRQLSGRPVREALLPQMSDAAIYRDGLRSLVRRLRPRPGETSVAIGP